LNLTIRAEKWVNNGYCIGYLNDETYFITGAIPGELVECEPISITKKFKQVKVVNVIEPSFERVSSDCDIFLLCGGCSFRHISYTSEIEIKKNLFLNEFNHKFPELKLDSDFIQIIRGHELHYRNNVQFKIQDSKKGFFKVGSNDLVEFPSSGCLNLPEEINHYIKKINPDSKKEGKLRLTESVFDYSENDSLFHFGDKKIKVPKNGFFQINRYLIEKWIEEIQDFIPEANMDILELFSGSGLISVFISSRCKSLVGYELEITAVNYAKENARLNHVSNLEFYTRNLYQEKISNKHLSRSLWIMNPPRNGLGNLILEQIQIHKPRYLVYSSCNYITLIQDLKKVMTDYFVKKATITDFFPRTPYFETLILLEKN
jgi:23S rRNA (uracil1939-C5)-methyltransferase